MAKEELNIFDLMKDWFSFCYENPEIINPNHSAMYFFILQHCNALGWKPKFGLPMQMTMDAIGIKNYRTFSNTFKDLIEWGFILLLQKSVNQYSANVIGLVKNTKATTKALSKATHKHSQKQVHGIVGIDKPITNIPITKLQEREEEIPSHEIEFLIPTNLIESYMTSENQLVWFESYCMNNHIKPDELKQKISDFVKDLRDKNIQDKNKKDLFVHFANWVNNGKRINKQGSSGNKESSNFKGLATKREIKSAI